MSSRFTHGRRAFSLVEILVVVGVLALLAAIAIPLLLGQRNRSKNSQPLSAVTNALKAARSYYVSNNGSYKGFTAAGMAEIETSLSPTDMDTRLAPGSSDPCTAPGPCANPRMIFVGDGVDGTDPASDNSPVVLCSMSRGNSTYCVWDDGNTTRYAIFTGSVACTLGSCPLSGSAIDWTSWTNSNAPPAAAVPANLTPPTISPAAPGAGGTATADTGSWSGTPSTYEHQWQKCSSTGSSCNDISGATSASFSVPSSYLGSTLRVKVRAQNDAGWSTWASSEVSSPVAPLPSLISAPALDNYAPASTWIVINGTSGSWNNATSYAYQWEVCKDDMSACGDATYTDTWNSPYNITYGTGTNYMIPDWSATFRMRLRVTASNASGSTTAYSTPTNTITSTCSGGCYS